MLEKNRVIVPWHNPAQFGAFCEAWGVESDDPILLPVQDTTRAGCAETKNRGLREFMQAGGEVAVVLDDDCYPDDIDTLPELVAAHVEALRPSEINSAFAQVTNPPSRGTPYHLPPMPMAASMGFWAGIGDLDAASQLVLGEDVEMEFRRRVIFGQWFPLCGMNLAFVPRDWWPWCQFIDVPRFDDIWAGWLWQKEAYRRGYGFNLNGPTIRHVRQSNVWRNLQEEAKYLERNETLWKDIAAASTFDYLTLRELLPVP